VMFCDVFEPVNIITILSQRVLEVSLNSLINVITRRNRVSVCPGNHKHVVDGQIAEFGNIRCGGIHSYHWNSKD
jgi:hypothetical protein